MHWLNVSYSVWLNRKYNRVGPLFQGRFKAILHETTEALVINRTRIAASGARETALFFGRHYGRLHLKELGRLAGGIHHNAVSIAIRRFTERLKSDSTLLAKFSLVQKALELC
jgi:chromosomal replication initiation ATPase DnaA